MAVIKDEDNEDNEDDKDDKDDSYSLFIGSKEIFRGSQEGAAKAAGVTGAALGLGVGVGVGWVISLLAATSPLAYLFVPIYIASCVLIEKELGED